MLAPEHMTNLLAEGGNVKIGEEGSEPINIKDRKSRRHDIDRMLHSINRHSQHKIWGYGAHALAKGSAYSGSTAHFMGKELDDEELGKHKKSFGDVDVQVPHGSEEHLKAALQPGTKHGKFTVVGSKKIGASVSAVMKHEDGRNHQVDFEYKDFDHKTQEPTPFSQFSQNSHIDDMKAGLKGVFHKHLISAITAKAGEEGYVEKTKKGASTYTKDKIRPQTFSIAHGMRAKHIPALDKEGKQKMHEGHKVYHELGAEGATYEKDLSKIHEHLFGKAGGEGDIKKMHSFAGLAKAAAKHLKPHEQRSVINDFAKRMYDKKSGVRLDKDDDKDNAAKVHAMRELRKHMPEHFDKLMYDKVRGYRENYYNKPAEKINEGTGEKHVHIAMAAGRFTGPTKEHQKLIDKTFSQKADHHYVYVMGPGSKEQTTEKDPLTVHEKIAHLKKLYPHKADSFVAGDTPHTKTPNQAMAHAWHKHQHDGDHLHLTVVAGEGDKGVVGKDAGGSAGAYEGLIHRLNKTRYPEREVDGKKVGGDYRMNYHTANVVKNERGTVSGSVMRKAARGGNPHDRSSVEHFRSLLHTGVSHSHAKELMHQIQRRSQVNEDLADVIGENYEIVEYAANDLNVPVQVVEAVVEGCKTVEEMFDRVQSICTKLTVNENTESLIPGAKDTFVIMYHPDKLYYQVDRVKVNPGQAVKDQAVIAERIKNGFMITSTHINTDDPQFIDGNNRYRMRQYRRQIDD